MAIRKRLSPKDRQAEGFLLAIDWIEHIGNTSNIHIASPVGTLAGVVPGLSCHLQIDPRNPRLRKSHESRSLDINNEINGLEI
jgi:hypothetical protein